MKIARTILDQLGGNKFLAMTGSRDFVAAKNLLRMRLARNKSGASHLTIILAGDDTYRMQFWKLAKASIKVLETIEGVRFDQMQAVFTDVTGLDTHL